MTSLTTTQDNSGEKQNGDLEIPWHLVAVFIGIILAAMVVAIIWLILKRRLTNIRRRQAALRNMNSTRNEAAIVSPLSHVRQQYTQPRYDLNQPRPDYTTPRFESPPKREEWSTNPQPIKVSPSLPEPKVEPVEIKPSAGAGTTVYSLVAKVDECTYMPPSKLVYADFNWSEENKEERQPRDLNTGDDIYK